jgi:phage/plasmid-associated DNA primase
MVMTDDETIELMSRLPLDNTLEDVFDKGLSTGATNAQMFGSRKPTREPYELSKVMISEYDGTDGEWCIKNVEIKEDEIDFDTYRSLLVQHPRISEYKLSKIGQQKLLKLDLPEQSRSPKGITEISSGRTTVDEYLEYADMINIKAINYYPLWTKMVWALHSMGDDYKDVALHLTKRSPLFQDDDYFNKIWNAYNPDSKATKEFIWGCAKQSDLDEYLRIRLKYNFKANDLFKVACVFGTDQGVANLFIDFYGENYKCISQKNKMFYEFNDDNIWEENESNYKIQNKLEEINDRFKQYLISRKAYMKTLNSNEDAYVKVVKEIKGIETTVNQMGSCSKITNISKLISNKIMDETFIKGLNKINDYLIPVKNNQMFNAETFELTERTINNKFNYWCDAEFKKYISEEDYKDMDDYFKALFNNRDDTKQVMINIIKSIFCGITFRNIFFFTGDGCNGKSLLFNLLNKIFGKAMDVISNDVIIEKKGGASSINTELAKLENTLLGYITELKEIDKLNTTNIKKISGGDPIDYRGLFNGNKTIIPTSNLCVLTNKLPHFEVEPAILKRMIVAPMNNVFEVDPSFQKKMMGKLDLLFTYIMKQGKIINELKDSDLTDEMLIAMEEYKEDNVKDYLGEYITKTYKIVDWSEDFNTIQRKDARIEADTFLTDFKAYLKQNGYRNNNDTKIKFNRNMKKYHSIGTYQSHHTVYFTGIAYIDDKFDEE